MYIAMNRFKVRHGQEYGFEAVWKNRKSTLHEIDGFIDFKLLRGPDNPEEGYSLYASHSVWASEDAFRAWTKSENFREAHRNAGQNKDLYLGPPAFEGFNAVEGI